MLMANFICIGHLDLQFSTHMFGHRTTYSKILQITEYQRIKLSSL